MMTSMHLNIRYIRSHLACPYIVHSVVINLLKKPIVNVDACLYGCFYHWKFNKGKSYL